jgi:hypothetical protein
LKPISLTRAAGDIRYRIDLPNSQPRRIKLIGLGRGGAAVVGALDLARLRDVQLVAAEGGVDPARLADAEMIFMVACSGDQLGEAAHVKQLARERNVMITGILLDDGAAHAELPLLRAASDMLIVASDASYVADMLEQLGA